MNDKAFFPCAGFGARMQEWTKELPKPLLPVSDIPLIYYSFYWAKRWGVKEAIVNSHYQAQKLESELCSFNQFKLKISNEYPIILGTGGGIRTAIGRFWDIDDEFLVMNPDFILFPEPDFSPWPTDEERNRFDCILYLSKKPPNASYTGLSLNGKKVSFKNGDFFYLGLSWMRGTCLSELRQNVPYDLANTFRELAEKNRLGGKIFPGEFLDLGEKDLYEMYRKTDFEIRLGNDWKKFIQNLRSET
ncbi:nucleotidyl transferase domain protein [Leptospira broomii serovar Hurstbridge str. 5399]|uniref:Nucleotidyl transferase domain protein n=1 Tax=Leptospira broomii serovar Hurstbridge str. 5399 TaxID=1049789 RepID=T0F261_9LEPT|nr:sugar phosphate nucleotidyltransferase [Leptospira broomii]EQA45195.1 nucleotidyl transferase domain protein [Leptospira broomii serovar Hurstbridge str. 5399]